MLASDMDRNFISAQIWDLEGGIYEENCRACQIIPPMYKKPRSYQKYFVNVEKVGFSVKSNKKREAG